MYCPTNTSTFLRAVQSVNCCGTIVLHKHSPTTIQTWRVQYKICRWLVQSTVNVDAELKKQRSEVKLEIIVMLGELEKRFRWSVKQAERRCYIDRNVQEEERKQAKEEGDWDTSYPAVWFTATGTVNPSLLPTQPLLLFTVLNTSLKTNLENKNYLFPLQPDHRGFQNHESQV